MRVFAFFVILSLIAGCAITPSIQGNAIASTPAANKEFIVSHIMCLTEKEATEALRRIRRGEKFADVARDVSMDPGTRKNGGKIAMWTHADGWSKNFAAEVKRLNIGEISSSPIQTEYGWHIVKVDAIR